MRRIAWWAFGALSVCTASASDAQQPARGERWIEAKRIIAFDEKCGILGLVEKTALWATSQEAFDQISGGNDLLGVIPKADAAEQAAKAIDCDSVQGKQMRDLTLRVGLTLRTLWIGRADAVVRVTSTQKWAMGIGPSLSEIAPWLAASIQALPALNATAVTRDREAMTKEATWVLAIHCRSYRSKDGTCPAPDGPIVPWYAKDWLERVERVGAVVADEQQKMAKAKAP